MATSLHLLPSIDLSQPAVENLWQDDDVVLARGRDGLSRVLVTTVAPSRPAPTTVTRWGHAYSLRDRLDPEWAARPLAFAEDERGLPVLVLEDPGGVLLARCVGTPWDISAFLRLAIGMALAVRGLHQRGLIHKDIKPAHLLVEVETGKAWLTGFGLASPLQRERLVPGPPELIAGTLAYMAPEQTGRMNRSIDSRSDLYSLGVVLYEMLTGRLPFTASNALEWIHCHIAREPPALASSHVPAQLAAVVTKLLAKAPEDRYQTSLGLEADLRQCQREWDTGARIEEFSLGTHDTPDRLLIPEKLYGREREIACLVGAFEKVVSAGSARVVLVSGYSGIGKSSVVNELHKVLAPSRGLFAAGKVDQYQRDTPYTTVAQAFRSVIRQVLSKSDAEVASFREALREALRPNGQLIINIIPELELIIGEQPGVPELPPRDAQKRFQLVFRRFLGVFARAEHPLILFLDDLQWLDLATLNLLQQVITAAEVGHLLLIGAYRDNEVSSTHPLLRTMSAVRDAGVPLEHIVLAPLEPDDVGALVANALRCDRARAQALTTLVHEKSGGNPFFAIQFLMTLVEEGMLAFDAQAMAWAIDLPRIGAQGFTDNLADLMVVKLRRLPDATRAALSALACLGRAAGVDILGVVLSVPERVPEREPADRVHEALWPAVVAGLISSSEGVYAFLHDRVQEAAYSLIPEADRPAEHLRIGRLLVSQPSGALDQDMFDIVGHLNRGSALIESSAERERLAQLNLLAGKQAMKSSGHASALSYLIAGAALVATESAGPYDLAFELEFHRAECEFMTGELASAEERLRMLSSRATGVVERARVTCLLVDVYLALQRFEQGLLQSAECLRQAGLDLPLAATDGQARDAYDAVCSRLDGIGIDELAAMPVMSDPASRAILDVLGKVASTAAVVNKNFEVLGVCAAIQLTLERGAHDGSCYAFTQLGYLAAWTFGDFEAAFRFGRLGHDLIDRKGLRRFEGFVCLVYATLLLPWAKHVVSYRSVIHRTFEVAHNTGDRFWAVESCNVLLSNLLVGGDPLVAVEREAEASLAFCRTTAFADYTHAVSAQAALIRSLRGKTLVFGSLDDGEFDERLMESHFATQPHLLAIECWYWVRKLQARFLAGDHAAALAASHRAQGLLEHSPGMLERAEHEFYAALAHAAACDSASSDEGRQHLAAVVAHHGTLELWTRHCPDNFKNRSALVAAEIARIEGRDLDAMRLYEEAMSSAREHGFVQNEGLAAEIAAKFYRGRGFDRIAATYLRVALAGYLRWGAVGKAAQLQRQYPELEQTPNSTSPTATIAADVEQIDLAAFVKMSQAVSREIILDQLIERLVVLAVEHAGATRGSLIRPGEQGLRVEAEATTRADGIDVRRPCAPADSARLPESILRFALRTRDSVLLHDALAANEFSSDAYLRERRPRSLLCLPLVKQNVVTAVLYLENNLAPHVFTPARTGVLALVASQAAISLENAALYSELQASLEEKNVLLKEVHHRVKNNLQLISSLLNLQAHRITDPATLELFADSRNRLRSMALVHENLYRAGNLARVPMQIHIQELCAHLLRAYAPRGDRVALELSVAEQHFDLGRALTTGLIVNELVSNALKHAFPGRRPGRISVELVRVEGTRHVLSVRDDGVGLPPTLDFESADSLGLQLVRDFTEQLGGRVVVSREGGTTFNVTFDEAGRS